MSAAEEARRINERLSDREAARLLHQLTIEGTEVRLDIAQCGCDPKAFGPRHDPSPRCESGKRPHCTCDTCF